MLKVTDATVRYGVIEALHAISFNIEQGEIVTLLGPMARASPPPCACSRVARAVERSIFSRIVTSPT